MKKKNKTDFYIHFGVDGVNRVCHASMPFPLTGLCVPISEDDKERIKNCNPNNLIYDGDKITTKTPVSIVQFKVWTKGEKIKRALCYVLGFATAFGAGYLCR